MLGFDAFKLTRQRSFTVLLVFSALTCMPLAFYDSFTNLFMNNTQINNAAAAMSMGQAVEICFLFTFPFFLRKLKFKGCIGTAIFVWIILYGLLAISAATGIKGLVYLALPLHGFCFTFFFVAGQLYVDKKAPENLRNSAQGLITFATYGAGKYIGTLIAGNVVNHHTSNGVYAWDVIWTVPCLFASLIFAGFMLLFKENEKETARAVSSINLESN